MIACSGNLASRSVAFSGPGGSAYVARSAKKMRDVWRDTPSGAIVHSSDSDMALSSWVSTPSRARHPCQAGARLLIFGPILFLLLTTPVRHRNPIYYAASGVPVATP